jgi:hypothetical protein
MIQRAGLAGNRYPRVPIFVTPKKGRAMTIWQAQVGNGSNQGLTNGALIYFAAVSPTRTGHDDEREPVPCPSAEPAHLPVAEAGADGDRLCEPASV